MTMTRRSGLKWMLAAFGVAASLTMGGRAVAEEPAKAEVGKPAPGFTLKTTDGKEHSLAALKGKTVVVQFASARCPWERAYQPILNDVAAKYTDKNVVFLGINANFNETPEEIKAIAEKESIPYAILIDKGNVIADIYQAQTTPHIYIIDGEGVLRYMGGIEKPPTSPAGAGKSDEQYLVPVLDALLGGKELPFTTTKATGCTIKRAKK